MTVGSLVLTLISVIGGGTLVPVLIKMWSSRRPVERRRADAREEERASKAAGEAVDAVRDVLIEMRTQREEDRQEIRTLRERLRKCEGRVVELEEARK